MAEEINTLSKPWQKFFNKFNEIHDLKVSQWKEVHVLGYICHRFEQHYNRKFAVTIIRAPSKSPDMVLVRKIIGTLGTTNMKVVKEYVDWVYDKKIIPQNRKIRSIGYFITPGFANEFYFEKEKNNKIDRSTKLPEEFLSIAQTLGVSVSTYGDLAFIKKALDQDPEAESREPYRRLFFHMKTMGFEESMLERI